ncbi:MAG: diaminopimelate epimerase [Burkholderiales bacterium]
MRLKFTKMHGLGNDFVVLDALARPLALTSEQLRHIADRHFGIGCDQVLQVEPPRQPDTDFYYRIFNADGGEVEQCGNGARCFVRYVRDRGLTAKRELRVGTRAGVIVPRLEDDGRVTVDMGVPEFEPSRIPFEAPARATSYALEVDGRRLEISALSMGNPHAVQVVPDIERAPVATEGPLIERHPRFPQRVNAGYVQIVSRRRILLRVHERGAGETLACGTGACAAVAAGVLRGLLDREVTVTARGGDLGISWAGEGTPVMMTGPAESVFEGEMEI